MNRITKYFSFLFTAAFLWQVQTICAQTAEQKHILFLSSYNAGFETLPEQTAGITSVLAPKGIRPDIEYMDSKRVHSAEGIANYTAYLRSKADLLSKYEVILAGDDNALQFVMDERTTLFKEIPVVFFCINDESRAKKAIEDGLCSGIIESISLFDTIKLAQTFQPETRKVIGIVDDTLTGLGDQKQFEELAEECPGLEFRELNVSRMTFAEAEEQIAQAQDGTIILYLSMFTDGTGQDKTIDEAVALITRASAVPVYRASIGGTGQGILGGVMISYRDQGRIAAEMALEILNGTPPSSLTPRLESPNRVILDANILKKFNISTSLVPPGAIVLNRTYSFAETHKEFLVPALSILMLLIIVILLVSYDDIRRRGITQTLHKSEQRFKDLALRDPLTSLYNRAGLHTWVSDMMGMKVIHGVSLNPEEADALPLESATGALVYIDLDNFKTINDAYGHKTGDEVLQLLGKRLKRFTDPSVCISRIGGDEFVIAVTGNNTTQTMYTLVPELRGILEERFVIGERSFFLTASCGLAYYPHHGGNFHELLQNVDAAMYRAKALGRDRFVSFSPEMRSDILSKIEIQQGIRNALEHGELLLHYQPQFELASGRIIGYEALVRWNHPKKGLLMPDSFITAAEEGGLISRIGQWVLEEACRFSNALADHGFSDRKISVNISPIQLQHSDFIERVLAPLQAYHIGPGQIMLEITESSLIEGLDSTVQKLSWLRTNGVPICLDDFGIGYSSLNYLRELPLDVLKIDRSFITDIEKSDNTCNLYEDIIRIAHKLNLQVVAEGVETQEQNDYLRDLNCNIVQGYYTGKPMSAGKTLEMEKDTAQLSESVPGMEEIS